MIKFETVVGLEIHARLATASKMFCSCPAAEADAAPNTAICPVCTGQPGALPTTNRKAVELAITAGLALNCRVNGVSAFARKNYFYPDLPKSYQISQHAHPLCQDGSVEIDLKPAGVKTIRITRAHLEEDAGKSLHALGSRALPYTLLDFNRCGAPLIEIVSQPDISSGEEAFSYLTEVKRLLRWTGTSSCDMEKGELRCDVNVSLRPVGVKALGRRVEIKNLNSFKAVKDAIAYEAARQAALLATGGSVPQDTRLWDEKEQRTVPMRSKELEPDYLYFPEPDLPAVRVTDTQLAGARALTGELPRARKARFMKELELSEYDASRLTADRELSAYFEACMAAPAARSAGPKAVANLVTGEFLARANELKIAPQDYPTKTLPPEYLAELAALVAQGALSASAAKTVFARVWDTGRPPLALQTEMGLTQVNDARQLDAWAREAIAASPAAAQDVRKGEERSLGPIVGVMIKLSRGKANPRLGAEIIKKILAG